MSGHSKWAKIKRQKGAADKKKGQVFSKLSRELAIAAQNGGDPTANFKLRLVMDRAKDVGMSRDAVERAIKRGTGEDKTAAQIEDIIYEGYGPGGTAFYVQAATDSKNRTTQNIRHIFSKAGGSMGNTGSTAFLFDLTGQTPAAKHVLEISAPSLAAEIKKLIEELEQDEDVISVYTNSNL